ncbi:multidrug MFS transporter [Sorangium cellulosum]|uniref:Multidrug MFS transporter n=1 Tax=Sorangium cellulosum TaxID=56 RepID=A0A4P2QB47_SORCE|nr:DHA2 family efflux MFS transporter permease subunit [Sorangium cellulosum]AUX26897.1 multidrug MFS transporter [Sorangium cellulosum]
MSSAAQSENNKKWLVLATIGLSVFMAMIDSSIVNLTLPTFAREMGVSFAAVQWIVLSYMLTVTTLMLSVGRLADIVGKRPMFVVGLAIFTVASGMCAIEVSLAWLIGWRVVQGVGASVVMALGPAILTEVFPPAERGKALGMIGTTVSAGIVLGPTLGGFILGSLGWGWIFLVNVPLGIIGCIVGARTLPAPVETRGQKFDIAGGVTMFGALLSLLLALTLGQRMGFGAPHILGLFAASVVLGAAFVKIENSVKQPLVQLPLFNNTIFSVNLVSSFLSFIATAGTLILMPFFLQQVLHYGAERTGLLLSVMPIVIGVVAPIAGTLSDKYGVRPITVAGLGVLLLGYLAVSGLTAQSTTLDYILRFLPVGLGLGLFQSPNNSAIMGSVPREHLGIASGLLAVSRTLGQTSGVAIIGALWSARVATHGGTAEGSAAPEAQVSGLHETALVLAGLVAVALLLTLRGTRPRREEIAATT